MRNNQASRYKVWYSHVKISTGTFQKTITSSSRKSPSSIHKNAESVEGNAGNIPVIVAKLKRKQCMPKSPYTYSHK